MSGHYEQAGDEELLAEWESGQTVSIEVCEPMVSPGAARLRQLCCDAVLRSPDEGDDQGGHAVADN